MLNCSGHNVGAYATPIIATIFPPAAVIATSMYDIGNSIMAAGGVYALAARYTDREHAIDDGVKSSKKLMNRQGMVI